MSVFQGTLLRGGGSRNEKLYIFDFERDRPHKNLCLASLEMERANQWGCLDDVSSYEQNMGSRESVHFMKCSISGVPGSFVKKNLRMVVMSYQKIKKPAYGPHTFTTVKHGP